MKDSKTYNTVKEWMDEGERLFGAVKLNWKFKCPSCGAVRTARDFKPYKKKGADASSVISECLGRYTGGRAGKDKCDWAAYGLFQGPHFVKDGDKTIAVFEFANDN